MISTRHIKYVNESQRIEQVSKHLTWEDQVGGWRTEDLWLTDNQQKLNEDLYQFLKISRRIEEDA